MTEKNYTDLLRCADGTLFFKTESEKSSEPYGFQGLSSVQRKLLAQLTSEFCQTFSSTLRRICSVTGPLFAIFCRITACNCATVICGWIPTATTP